MNPATYPWLRRGLQIAAIGVFVMAAYCVWPGHASPPPFPVEGSVWAARVGGFDLVDPLAGLQTLLSGQARVAHILTAILVPVILAVALGRVFCSWVCPAGFLFELGDAIRRWLGRLGFKGRGLKAWHGAKFVILGSGAALTVWTALPLLGHVYPPAMVSRELHGAVFHVLGRESGPPGPLLTGVSVFLFLVLVVESTLSPRLWCRSLCPGGALYSLLGRFRVVRVKRRASACTDCALCVPACPMGLNPMKDQLGMACDNCLECITSCPDSALALGLGVKDGPPKADRTLEGGRA